MKKPSVLFPAIAAVSMFLTLAQSASAQAVRPETYNGRDAAAGEIIVRFRGVPASAGLTIAGQDADIASAEQVGLNGALRLSSRARDVAALMSAYAARPDVAYAEPNYIWHTSDIPNDSLFPNQLGLKNTSQGPLPFGTINHPDFGTTGADIKADLAWDRTHGSRASVVGVIDTGIDYNHRDLAANIWSAPTSFTVTIAGQLIVCAAGTHGFNAIARTCDPMDDDVNGHGTQVAGIIGAAGNNAVGMSGVSPIASMMGLKFMGPNGTGTTADAIAAIDFAIQARAFFSSTAGANVRILNASWSGAAFSQSLLDEINLANNSNMAFVAAAGNSDLGLNSNNDATPNYPASYNAPNVIAVTASDYHDSRAASPVYNFWANYGATSVHLAAPGIYIESTLPGNRYTFGTGTSASAAMVSGAAALILSACSLTTAALKADILNTVDALPDLKDKTVSGGRLNVFQAVSACQGASPVTFSMSTGFGSSPIGINGSTTFNVAVTGINGFAGSVSFSVTDLPSGVTATFNPTSITGNGSSTLTVVAGPNVAAGVYVVGIRGTSGAIAQSGGVAIGVASPIALHQKLPGTISYADLLPFPRETNSPRAIQSPNAQVYQLTLAADTAVTINLLGGSAIYLFSNNGTLLNSNTTVGVGGYRRMGPVLLSAGSYVIEVKGSEISVNFPLLTGISPIHALAGSIVNMTFVGSGFTAPVTIGSDSALTVSNIFIVNDSTVTATVAVNANDPFGAQHNLTITTPDGTTTAAVLTTVRPPSLTSLSLTSVTQGTAPGILATGTNFINPMSLSILSGTGITVTVVSVVDSTSAVVGLSVADNASPGPRDIRLTSDGGTTNAMTITVQVAVPTLTSLSPTSASQGSSVSVTLQGTNLTGLSSVDAGSGIVASLNNLGSSFAVVQFKIAPDAVVGPRSVTVTRAFGGGTSNALTFNVTQAVLGLSGITPVKGVIGSVVGVTLTGVTFSSPMTVDAGSGIGVSNVSIVNSFTATATFTIASSATLGRHNVTVSAAGATSNAITYTVLNRQPRLSDFDGDGKTDLIWNNPVTGQTVAWLMNGTSVASWALLYTDTNWRVTQAPDLDGDGKSDLVWLNSATGETVGWVMNGTAPGVTTSLLVDPEWRTIQIGDFNGDGRVDLLWSRPRTGETADWLMNGTTASSYALLYADPNWSVTQTADLNGDGAADLIWYNSATGETVAWLMNGTTAFSSASLLTNSAWRVTQTGDFNGDGKDDLLWTNAATGETVLWLMDGTRFSTFKSLYTDPNWRVTQTADLNGDGKTDLIWYNAASGETAVWLMNGSSVISFASLLVDPNWKVTQTGDFNGDGKSDLIWYNAASGQTVVWLMNGMNVSNYALLLTDPNWRTVPVSK